MYSQAGSLLFLGLTLGPHEELQDPIITWVVPYEQISIDQQKAAWFMNGTSKVEKQHPIQNTVTLRPAGAKTEEERKNQFNCFACCFPCNDGRIE